MTRPDFGTGKPIVVGRDEELFGSPYWCECQHCEYLSYWRTWSAAMEAAHAHRCDGIRLRWLRRELVESEAMAAKAYQLWDRLAESKWHNDDPHWRYCAGLADGERSKAGLLAGILAEIGDGQ